MRHKIMIINGPNLNMLGERQVDLYANKTLDQIKQDCIIYADKFNFDINFLQTNSEEQIITWIHEGKNYDGIIINAAAYSHTSIAIMDALLILNIPIIEVHISNIFKREQFRHKSYIAKVATGVICGCGGYGYILALNYLNNILNC